MKRFAPPWFSTGRGRGDQPELIAWSTERLAAYKYPRKVVFTDGLPLGPSGKVLKRELVAQYRD